jgi:linoleoyl-CoA desaturase
MNIKKVRFTRPSAADFYSTVKQRVHDYFAENNISKHADYRMVVKTIFMVTLYLGPFVLLLSGLITNVWVMLGMWVIMGFGMSGIGLSIMHDANHGAYSENPRINKLIGYIIMLVGGDDNTWKIQHNVLHHTYTNMHELDEDIATIPLMRFSPNEELKPIHRFQHYYAWFFYGLMTFSWSTAKDIMQIIRYNEMGLTKSTKKSFPFLIRRAIIAKVAYHAFTFGLPLLFAPFPWWQLLIGYGVMHFLCGLTLACIFQPAHVMPNTEFYNPEENSTVENTWAVHQMLTTTNFAPSKRIFSWFVGGLNYQVEHHLFPTICHVHYRKLSEIVKKTAEEFHVPYNSLPTFRSALITHGRMLKELGRA